MREVDSQSIDCTPEKGIAKRINGVIHRVVDKVAYCANLILASLMILMAVSHAYNVYKGLSEPHIMSFIGYVIIILCGLAIILDKNRNLPRSVGLYALGLGLYRFFTSIPHLVPHSNLNILFYAIMALGLNMALSGRAYIRGKSRARKTMMMGSIIFLFMAIVFLIYIYSGNKDAVYVIRTQFNTFLLALMYFTFILILDSETLRKRDWLEVHNRTLDGIRRTYCLEKDAVMLHADAQELVDGGWPAVDDDGPVVSEMQVRFINGSGYSYLIAQKWKGSDDTFITMADHAQGSIIQASRITVNRMGIEDDRLILEAVNGDLLAINLVEGCDELQE